MDTLEIWPNETGILDLPDDLAPLTLSSMDQLRQAWSQKRAALAESDALQTFSDQLQREWAIETGQIENLYDIERGITMTLIEQGFSAAILERGSTNKPPEYVLALLADQRDALQGLFDFVKQQRPLSTGYIKELHAAMTRSQETTEAFDPLGNRLAVPLLRGEWKNTPNYPIRDGKQFLYCPPEQTSSEMERLVQMHLSNREKGVVPEAQAAWLHHRFTQIHPFQDGNGRVARALASLVLIQAEMFPLVVPREEKDVYLQTLEDADAGDLRPLVLLIARRQQVHFEKAIALLARGEQR